MNILMIMADQLRPDLLGCSGNPAAATPRIDQLAGQGLRFSNAYTTCPVCVSARASILTGLYTANHEVFDNGAILPSDIPTHNHYLNAAGYDTALIGKAHFIGPDQLHGFQLRPMTNIYPANMIWMKDRMATVDSGSHSSKTAVDYLAENVGVRQWSMQIDYDEEVVQESLRFLSMRRSQPSGSAQKPIPERSSKPFFLQVSFNHPHEPFHVLQEYWDRINPDLIEIPKLPQDWTETYTAVDRRLATMHGTDGYRISDPKNMRALLRAYLAAAAYLDDCVGKVLDALEQFGLAEETMVLLVSDHGDMLGEKNMVQKRVLYDPSVKVPLIVRMPESFGAGRGRVVETAVSVTDIAPTLLDLIDSGHNSLMDGRSLVPLLKGNDLEEVPVFSENHSEGVQHSRIMVRWKDWKYTRDLGGEHQLFNLADDPGEWTNLTGRDEASDIEAQLHSMIQERFNLEAIDRRADLSFRRRLVIRESMKHDKVSWNWKSNVDVDREFWRNG